MNTEIILAALSLTKTTMTWLSARNNGNSQSALQILQSADLTPFGLDKDTLELVNLTKAGLAYITQRGVLVDQIISVIELAESENRDVTIEEVRQQLDLTAVELDETEELINQLTNPK